MNMSWSALALSARRSAGRALAVLAVALVVAMPAPAGEPEEPTPPAAKKEPDSASHERVAHTLAAMRSLATALEVYGIDNGHVPKADTVGDLEKDLVPTYVDPLPRMDGWERELVVVSDGQEAYEIRSLGRDGKRDEGPPAGETDDPDRDIVMERTAKDLVHFTQWPRGAL